MTRRLSVAAVEAPATPQRYLTAEQAGLYTGHHAQTIKHAARSGELAGYKASRGASWRFTTDDLDAWMNKGRVAATTSARGRAS